MKEFAYSNVKREIEVYGYDSMVRSHCRMCHGGCGVLVYTVNGRVAKIAGDPECPINHGTLCAKGIASAQLAYHPDRLTYPVRRLGPKGSGTEPIARLLLPDSEIGLDTNSEADADADEEPDDNVGNLIEHKRLTGADRQAIYTLAEKMRQEGNSWENIARSVASKGYPTISGKGTWRGVMVKNIFEKLDA